MQSFVVERNLRSVASLSKGRFHYFEQGNEFSSELNYSSQNHSRTMLSLKYSFHTVSNQDSSWGIGRMSTHRLWTVKLSSR